MNREVKVLLKKIAKEKDLKFSDLEKAFEAPFKLQAYNMKNRCKRSILHFPSLRIPYFGIFYCPDWHKKRLKKKNDAKK
jgi:hypothetical protein